MATLWEDCFSYVDLESLVLRYHGEVLFPKPNDSGTLATSSDYYVGLDRKDKRDFSDFNAVHEPLE